MPVGRVTGSVGVKEACGRGSVDSLSKVALAYIMLGDEKRKRANGGKSGNERLITLTPVSKPLGPFMVS